MLSAYFIGYYWSQGWKWENNINICGIIREIEIEIQIEIDREKGIQNINLCKIMYTQQDSELIFTDSRVNNIGIWMENSSPIRVGDILMTLSMTNLFHNGLTQY